MSGEGDGDMLVLVAFLRARLDEDAAPSKVDAWHEPWCLDRSERQADGSCFYCGAVPDPSKVKLVPQPDKVLCAVEAKRRTVDEYEGNPLGFEEWPLFPLFNMTREYADHSDFQSWWAPDL